ncbi:MAG: cytochrome c, class I [Nitrospinae bacterium]|nr:cytochrome c, class I [Nitrospinota bacterium]
MKTVMVMLSAALVAVFAPAAQAQQGDQVAAAAKNTPVTQGQPPAKEQTPVKPVNPFNRLMQDKSTFNPPPPEDGIHDPGNEGTFLLQPPREAFGAFVKSNFGNRVDWVKTLDEGKINPRWDRLDPKAEPDVLDLNIVRVVRGSMPDVLYPHAPHTKWLTCENCHDAIFVPEAGKNQISMAAILMGEKCGVCHGKVAFPVTECRKCHSLKKEAVSKN